MVFFPLFSFYAVWSIFYVICGGTPTHVLAHVVHETTTRLVACPMPLLSSFACLYFTRCHLHPYPLPSQGAAPILSSHGYHISYLPPLFQDSVQCSICSTSFCPSHHPHTPPYPLSHSQLILWCFDFLPVSFRFSSF
jgi:hypothetical protein